MLTERESQIQIESGVCPLRRIKVLHFSACPDGGIKRHILDLVQGMPHQEFEFQGAFIDPARCAVLGQDPKDTYFAHFARLGLKCYLLDFPRHVSPARDLKTLLQLIRILHTEKPDILHCHSSKAGMVGRAAGLFCRACKILYSPHNLYFVWQTGLRRRLSQIIEKLFAKVGTLVAVSASEERDLHKYFPGSTVIKVNNGIRRKQLDRLAAASAKSLHEELRIPKKAFIILSITRLERVKDVPTLLRGFARLRSASEQPIHLVVAGDGIQRTMLESLAVDLGVSERTHLIGWRGDISRLLHACHCVALTSLSEGLPYALLESAAAGKPIIATRVQGSEDVVLHQQTGFLIAPGDAEALAQRLEELVLNPDLRRQFGENARRYVASDFDLDCMCKAYGNIYRSYVH